MTPWTTAHQASLFFNISQSLLKFMYINLVLPSNHLILCHPLALLPSTFPSIRVGSYHQVAKELELQLQCQSSNEYSGLISFTIDLLDLLAVQGTLKSLFQDHNWKASVLWCSAFFMSQLSHPCMTTGKTIALTRWIFVSKLVSLLCNMLSRFIIAFLSRSKCLLNSFLLGSIFP